MHDLVVGLAGSGGDGIVSAGEALIQSAAKEGYLPSSPRALGRKSGEGNRRAGCVSPQGRFSIPAVRSMSR